MTGELSMGNNKISDLLDAVDPQDAVALSQLIAATNGITGGGGSGTDSFDGDRNIKRAHIPISQNMGTSNIVDFLNAVFFPFMNATISLSITPTLVEEGTLQNVNCSGSVIANDETAFSFAYVNPTPGASISFTAQAGVYSVQDTAVAVDTSYRSYITTGNAGEINSPQRSINFVYPYFWGTSATDLTAGGTAFYDAITKKIQVQGTKAATVNALNQYIYFAYPAEYPDLTAIDDPNGFPALSSFTKYEVTVTSTGLDTDWTHNYKIYRNNTGLVGTGGDAIFIFYH